MAARRGTGREGQGARDASAPGPRRPRRRHEVRAFRCAERARARERAAHGGDRRGRLRGEGARRRDRHRGRLGARRRRRTRSRIDAARADRDTVGGVVEVRAKGVPPGLGSYATKEDRLDARLAWTLMGTQAVKGVEIGDGLRPGGPAGLRGPRRDPARRRRLPARDESRRRIWRRACPTARRSSCARR